MQYCKILDFIKSLYPNRDFIPLHEPFLGGNTEKYLQDCVQSTFVSSVGKFVDQFEQMICDYTGAPCAIATVNGTAALHIALELAGVKTGDLVLTQPLTFIATCNAISYCGAEPVFIDIENQSLGLSAQELDRWLLENAAVIANPNPAVDKNPMMCIHKETGKRISACVPMHAFGLPCQIDSIVEVCHRYGIPVVEDAAESLGSYYKGRHTGTFGRLGIFSFNGNKTITTGGGGMIITNDLNLGKLAKHITTTAKVPHPWNFYHDMIGYNYRLPNLNAALGCAQMELLPDLLRNKRETALAYREFFKDVNGFDYIDEPAGSKSNFWLNAVRLPDSVSRDAFLQESNANKVMTRPVWTLMNRLPMFKNSLKGTLNCAERNESQVVNLPSSYRDSETTAP